MPGTDLDTGETAVNEVNNTLCLPGAYILVRQNRSETANK